MQDKRTNQIKGVIACIPILSVPDEGYSRNASCAFNFISTFTLLFICNCL